MTDAKNSPYKTTSSKVTYKNPWMEVEENQIIHPNGKKGIYGVVKTKDSVIIVPVDADGNIFLIHAFSYPAQKWHWELPAGGSDGEDYLTASKRELQEETGIVAKNWQQIGLFRPMDGLMPEKMAILLATDLEQGEILTADDNGVIDDRKFFSPADVEQMTIDGKIDEGNTIAALYSYNLWQQRSKNEP